MKVLAKYEVRMKTSIGELTLRFDTTQDLQESLASLDTNAVVSSVTDKLGNILVTEPRRPKAGAETLYQFTPRGKVELNKIPSSPVYAIGLLLYAYDPEPVHPDEIFRATGARVGTYIANATYKKFFDKTPDGKVLPTHLGRLWVQNEVLSKVSSITTERTQ